MGTRRGNLIVLNKKPSQETHYRDKSYHSRFAQTARKSSNRDEPCTFTFHVDDGERSALAKPWGDISGAEGYWFIRCGHTASLDSVSERGMAGAAP